MENIIVSLTESEAKTLDFYLDKGLIHAEGLKAIGFDNEVSVRNLKSIKKKLVFAKN